MRTPNTIIKRLKLAMKNKNMNQAQLADRLKVTRGAVSHWFSGEAEIDPKHYPTICHSLDISMPWLVDGAGSMAQVIVKNKLEILMINMLGLQTEAVKKNLLFILKNWRN